MRAMKLFLVLPAMGICLLLSGQPVSVEKKGMVRAGFAKADITPDYPVMLYGYNSRTTPSEGVHDRLSARVVVFENDSKKLVLVSSDLGSFGSEVYQVIQKNIMDKFNLDKSELFLSAVHSHSSPSLTLAANGNPGNVRYTQSLNGKLTDLVGEAIRNLKPVHVGAGAGSSPVNSNRRLMTEDGSVTLGRNIHGSADKEVLVVKITEPGGKPLGLIYDYATHATCMGSKNMLISGDLLGLSAQFVEKILGGVSLVFAGASGNICPWYKGLSEFNTEPGWIPEPVLLGTLLGEEVVHVFRGIRELTSTGMISTSFETLECPRRSNENDAGKTSENQRTTVPVNITAARLGDDVAFIGFNVEMLTELGMAIKSGSPFRHTFIITHCNGSSGYLPPAGLYNEGGYEIRSTRFEPGSGEMVVKKALRMLYDLK